jgi:hypothetical protein
MTKNDKIIDRIKMENPEYENYEVINVDIILPQIHFCHSIIFFMECFKIWLLISS